MTLWTSSFNPMEQVTLQKLRVLENRFASSWFKSDSARETYSVHGFIIHPRMAQWKRETNDHPLGNGCDDFFVSHTLITRQFDLLIYVIKASLESSSNSVTIDRFR